MLKKSLEEDKRKGDETSGEWNREKKRGEERREEKRSIGSIGYYKQTIKDSYIMNKTNNLCQKI